MGRLVGSWMTAVLLLAGTSGCTMCPDPYDCSGPVPNGSPPQNDFFARSNGILPLRATPDPWPPVVSEPPEPTQSVLVSAGELPLDGAGELPLDGAGEFPLDGEGEPGPAAEAGVVAEQAPVEQGDVQPAATPGLEFAERPETAPGEETTTR